MGFRCLILAPSVAALLAATTNASLAQSGAPATSARPPAETWSTDEIVAEQAICRTLLKDVHAVIVPEPPIKEGECGSPIVFKVMSIGTRPAVTLSPPATLTCEMIGTLHTWIKQDLQPLARRHLDGPLINIVNMSSYSCRNAYGRKGGRLSEHGRANALDIAGFETARTGPALVLNSWGPTGREIRALAARAERRRKAAAAKAAAEQAKAAQAQSQRANAAQAQALRSTAPPMTDLATSSTTGPNLAMQPNGAPGLVIQNYPPNSAFSSAFGSSNRLGGPKHRGSSTAKAASNNAPAHDLAARQTIFIRKAHDTACKRFRTTLGPEANRAHKNHFHVDMAERRNGSSYCE